MKKGNNMPNTAREDIFQNRGDAGRRLAQKLQDYQVKSVLVLAIPNGGLPVAFEVAIALDAKLDIIVSRKIPIPLRPEGGFGALTDDGTVILNEELAKRLNLPREQINHQIRLVTANILQRSLLYRGNRPISIVSGKTVVIVDDGLASGYTMLAAVESVRKRRPEQVVVAVPVASQIALEEVEKVADKVVTVMTSNATKFYLSDFYRYWNDLGDKDALKYLEDWQSYRFRENIRSLREKH
jgi:predicted phosphoribosyltransferase